MHAFGKGILRKTLTRLVTLQATLPRGLSNASKSSSQLNLCLSVDFVSAYHRV